MCEYPETKHRFQGVIRSFRKYQKWYGRWTFVSQGIIPVLISTGNENIELIAVQGKIGNHDIRIITKSANHSAN